jgi:hypothetical protein
MTARRLPGTLMAVAFGYRSRRRPRLVTDVLALLRSLYRAPRVYLSSNSAATTSRGEDFTFQQSTARGIVLSENSNAFHYQFHWHYVGVEIQTANRRPSLWYQPARQPVYLRQK